MESFTHPILEQSRMLGLFSAKQLEVAHFYYEFVDMTPNEVMEEVKKKHPHLTHLELTGINKLPSIFKERNLLKVSEERRCRVTGNKAQALIPTYELPLAKGHKLINQKYIDFGDRIIDGGMGLVKFVLDKDTGQKVALKQCKEKYFQCRFKTEVELLLKFQHLDQVIDILDYNLESEPYYFTMPIAPMGDSLALASMLNDSPQLQQKVFISMLDCIDVLHQNGSLHRDIKPQNFLVFDDYKIVVIDMGVARDSTDEGKTRVTNTHVPGGTEEYAPPEFYEDGGFKTADATWDIYCLGKTFYKLLTGRNARYMRSDGIPDSVYSVLEKACSNDKKMRFQSVEEFKSALEGSYRRINSEGPLLVDSPMAH